MAVYAVLTPEKPALLIERLNDAYNNGFYVWEQRIALLRTDDAVADIAKKIGVKTADVDYQGEPLDDVIIFQVSPNYWGHAERNIWAWLELSFND